MAETEALWQSLLTILALFLPVSAAALLALLWSWLLARRVCRLERELGCVADHDDVADDDEEMEASATPPADGAGALRPPTGQDEPGSRCR